MTSKQQNKRVGVLVITLVIVLIGGVLFVGATSGWFDDSKVILDAEYICEENCGKLAELNVSSYETLVKEKKSFIVFIDQDGCTMADKLEGYTDSYAEEKGVWLYKMMFSEVKQSSLYNFVKYYPSVAIISKGKVVAWLRADNAEDAEVYNDYGVFQEWMDECLQLK